MTPHAERLVRVEVEMQEVKKELAELKAETREQFDEINKKLDGLLELKNKGAGAFWFFGLIFGSAFIGLGTELLRWFTGR